MNDSSYYYGRHVANQHDTDRPRIRPRRTWWEREGEVIAWTLGLLVFGYALGILTIGLLFS
jgi:hypothetical protein